MSVRKRGGQQNQGPRGKLTQRQREFDSLNSDKQKSRKRPGSMSGRK